MRQFTTPSGCAFVAFLSAVVTTVLLLLFGCSGTRMNVGYGEGQAEYDLGGNTARRGDRESERWWVEFSFPLGPQEIVLMKEPRSVFNEVFTPPEVLVPEQAKATVDIVPENSGSGDSLLWWLLAGGGVAVPAGYAIRKKVKDAQGSDSRG